MKNTSRRQALGMMAAATGTALYTPALAQATPKVAFTLLFPEGAGGDVGWDYEHMRGVNQARAAFGDRVQIDTFHEVAEWGKGDDAMFRKLVADGYDMIFTTSAGYMQSTIEVAHEAPNVLFENCAGFIRSNNVSTYNIRWYEGRVIQGFLAATLSKTNRVGYLAAYPIPQVVRGINSAFHAARQVNPDIEFDIVWLNTWFDPAREAQVARELTERGADILMQHTVTTAAMEHANEAGIFAFGQGSDMSKYGPQACLTSSINNWGPYYERRIGEFLNGTWQSEDTWGGLAENMLAMGPLLQDVPGRVLLQAQDVLDRVRSGDLHAFEGPIRRQDGSGWLAPGETANDSSLLTMNYYIDGVKSVFPSAN